MVEPMAVTDTQNPVSTLPATSQMPETGLLASATPLPVARSSVKKNTALPAPVEKTDVGDPSQFALNEAVLAKSWPERDSAMQGYLIRHNQMAGNSAGNDLISYAELLAEPASAETKPAQDQQ
jgi:hypothetical protein